jgi:hypothetical protein
VTSVTVRFSLNYIRTEKRKGSLKYLALDAAASELPDRDLLPNDAEGARRSTGRSRNPPREKLI